MKLGESLRLSWRSIRGHALRSTLTTLGVIIGVAAVITFVTLGASLQAGILGQFGDQEATSIYTWAADAGGDDAPGMGAKPVFSRRDVAALQNRSGIDNVIPYGVLFTNQLSFDGDDVAASDVVKMTTRAYLDEDRLAEGRLFRPGEREAVVNPLTAGLFERNLTVGDTIRITLADGERTDATVVGVLENSRSLSAFEGLPNSRNPQVYVPLETYKSRPLVYSLLIVEATSPAAVDTAKESARAYLTSRSDARTVMPRNHEFKLRTSADLLEQIRNILELLKGFITGVAAISLVVGAIGIANIMLVSVTERTREIGVMKAVGAQNRSVLLVFLAEAVVLGVIGAVFGVALGAVGGWAVTEYLGYPLTYPLEWFPIAVVVGVGVGVVAGLYPAWSAARTDPIEALRYE